MPAGVAGTFHNRGGCWGSLLSGLGADGKLHGGDWRPAVGGGLGSLMTLGGGAAMGYGLAPYWA